MFNYLTVTRAPFTRFCVKDLPIPIFLSSFLLERSYICPSCQRVTRKFHSATGSVFRKASWPNLMLISVEQILPDIVQSKKKTNPDIAKFARIIGESRDVLGLRHARQLYCPRDADWFETACARLVPASFRIHNDWQCNGKSLPDPHKREIKKRE